MNTPFFRVGLGVLLVTIIIFMLNQINFVFAPLILLVKTVTVPFLIAGVLYYLFLPMFQLLLKKGINKNISILSIFVSFALILSTVFVFLGPVVSRQFKRFIDNIPTFASKIEKIVKDLLDSQWMQDLDIVHKVDLGKIASSILSNVDEVLIYLGNNIFGILSTVTGTAFLLIVVPFILFYLLKDGHKIPQLATKVFTPKHGNEVKKILGEMNFALKSYIQGQIIVSFIVGCLVFIGYLIIGLDYSLLLAIIAMVTNLIPFVGPFIGLAFALAVGLMQSFNTGLLVIVVVLVVQQVESNLISPQIMGKKLDIHPLTIILLLLFAGKFAGVIGLLIAVPTYAVMKVIVSNGWRLWKIKKVDKPKKEHPFA